MSADRSPPESTEGTSAATARGEQRTRAFPYVTWVGITAVLLVLQHLSNRVFRDPNYRGWPFQGLRFYVDGWTQFDGHEYIKIAEGGYWYIPGVRSPIVWFPVYPMSLRAMNQLIDDPILAGMVVASLGGLAAVGVYWRWLRQQGMEDSIRTIAFLVLLTYPYAWYLYGVVHADAVFLALTVGAFLMIEQQRLLLAGVLGAVATATRPTGMALLAALLVLSFERGGVLAVPHTVRPGRWGRWVERFAIPVEVRRDAFRPALLLPLLSLVGIGLWMVYLGVSFGDPMAFRTNQTVYHPSSLPWLKLPYFIRIINFWDSPSYALTIIAQSLIAALVLLSAPFVGRRFGWGYAVYVTVLVAIPTVSTADFMGTGRYLIAAFPTAALIGEWLAGKSFRWWWIGASGTTMALLSMGFARSWYLT